MVFLPLYLLVMNWVLLFQVSVCWIEYWIWEHLMYVLRWDICGDNGMFYWFTWCMFWHSTRRFPRWHWGNLCIGVDARFRPTFSGRNFGGTLWSSLCSIECYESEVVWCISYGVILVRTLGYLWNLLGWLKRLIGKITLRWPRTLQQFYVMFCAR